MKMTRKEVVEKMIDYGYDSDYAYQLLSQCEKENCEYSNRVITDYDDYAGYDEYFACSDKISDGELEGCNIACYYYQPIELTRDCEDLGLLDWKIDHYEIV